MFPFFISCLSLFGIPNGSRICEYLLDPFSSLHYCSSICIFSCVGFKKLLVLFLQFLPHCIQKQIHTCLFTHVLVHMCVNVCPRVCFGLEKGN